jgi:hypothetical protein
MNKQRYTQSELDARLKFLLGTILGLILLFTASGILYGLLFVTQPIGAQSENDKMFFNVLGSIATFITGTLAGILIGKSGADEIKNMGNAAGEPTPAPAPTEPTPTEPEATEEKEVTKTGSAMPDAHDADDEW